MKRNNISYPYPVLGIGDDILPRPSITVEPIKADSKNYYVTVKVQMENNDISTLIKNGFAEYGLSLIHI